MNKISGRKAIYFLMLGMVIIALFLTFVGYNVDRMQDLARGIWLIRPMFYTLFFAVWGYLNNQRIIHVGIRTILNLITYFNIFWVFMSTVSYNFLMDQETERFFWYLSHIPYMVIPVLMTVLSLYIGHSDTYKLVFLKSAAYWIPGLGALILLLTNDLHEFVYRFSGSAAAEEEFEFGIGYYILSIWICACLIRFGVVIFRRWYQLKHPVKGWSLFVTYGIVMVSVILTFLKQAIIYDSLSGLFFNLGLAYCALLEACIYCGIISSNTGYIGLFRVGTLGERITDKAGNIVYESLNSVPLSEDKIQKVLLGPVNIGNNYVFNSAPIKGGYVIWQEDVTEIIKLLNKLNENKKELEERVEILKENFKTKYLIYTYKEKNRIYDEFMNQTSEKIQELVSMLEAYDQTDDPDVRKSLLINSFIIGSYIKRRGNMVYMRQNNGGLDFNELALSFSESLSNLECIGIECGINLNIKSVVRFESALECYERIENVIEKEFAQIQCLWINAREVKKDIQVHIEMEISEAQDMESFKEKHPEYNYSEGIWSTQIFVKKVGFTA